MVIGSDRGTARSVSSLERSSRLPGSVCFCPFWRSTEEEGMRVLLSSEQTHDQHATKWRYLLSYLCRCRSEAKASWCILLLLYAFDTRAEMKLNVEALIWGEVLLQEFELISVITSLQIKVETVIQKHVFEFWIWNYKKSFRCYIITALYLLCHVSLLKLDNSLVVFETHLASLWWFIFNFSALLHLHGTIKHSITLFSLLLMK